MDWKRAKSILIIVFTILNIVLAVVLYKNLFVEEISSETISNTRKILEKNNVHIEIPIPKYVGKDYILQHGQQSIDYKKIASVLLGEGYYKKGSNEYENGTKKLVFNSTLGFEYTDTNGEQKVYTDSKNGIDTYLKDISKKMGIPFGEFLQDGYYPGIKSDKIVRVIYKGSFKGYTVFDNYIEIEVHEKGITSIRYQYKKPLSITSRDINVIPAYEILITKMTNYPGISIAEVDIGFKGYTHVDQETKTLYEGLAWRIKTTDGKEFYFNARSGEQIT